MRIGSIPGDAPQSSPLRSLRSSPAPTDIFPETEYGTQRDTASGDDGPASDDSEFESLDSDPELPTLLQILRGEA